MTLKTTPLVSPNGLAVSFWTIQSIGWTAYFVVIYITFLTIAPPGNTTTLLLFKAFRAFTGFVLTSFALRPLYRRLGERLSVERAIVLVLSCATVLGVVWTGVEFAYVTFTSVAPSVPGYLARSPRIALDYAMTLAAWSALYLGARFWRSWQSERERALVAEALTREAQLEMLRYQINPHFLFNALNSLRALVDEDATRAKATITQLSEFLRYSLLSEPRGKVALSEELEAVMNYLAIEKTRFEGRLEVDLEIDPAARDRAVPGFLLNPLVENAVKHGFRTSPKPLRIRLAARIADDGLLVVEVWNSGALAPRTDASDAGLGVNNVRKRLETLFGARGILDLTEEQGWVRARVEIPA